MIVNHAHAMATTLVSQRGTGSAFEMTHMLVTRVSKSKQVVKHQAEDHPTLVAKSYTGIKKEGQFNNKKW